MPNQYLLVKKVLDLTERPLASPVERTHYIVSAVASSSVLTKPFLYTKWPNFAMLFYYMKRPGHSTSQSSNLALKGALE